MSPDQHDADHQAAIYASTPTDSMESINDRLDALRDDAKLVGLEVVAQYVDLRGENTQFLQMIADATAPDPPFRKVLLANRSRDSSQIDDLEPHRARLAAHEVEIISASELSLRALGPAVGAMLREQYSLRVRRGMRAIAQRGFYAFANAPCGNRKIPVWDGDLRRHKLEPDPRASETVRWIFDLRLEGATHLEIVAELGPRRQTTWHQPLEHQTGAPHPSQRGLLRHQLGGEEGHGEPQHRSAGRQRLPGDCEPRGVRHGATNGTASGCRGVPRVSYQRRRSPLSIPSMEHATAVRCAQVDPIP